MFVPTVTGPVVPVLADAPMSCGASCPSCGRCRNCGNPVTQPFAPAPVVLTVPIVWCRSTSGISGSPAYIVGAL